MGTNAQLERGLQPLRNPLGIGTLGPRGGGIAGRRAPRMRKSAARELLELEDDAQETFVAHGHLVRSHLDAPGEALPNQIEDAGRR